MALEFYVAPSDVAPALLRRLAKAHKAQWPIPVICDADLQNEAHIRVHISDASIKHASH